MAYYFDTMNFCEDETGVRWAAYAALIGCVLSFILDAILPGLVFGKNARKLTMTVAWSCSAFFGTAVFFGLVFVNARWSALFLFSVLDITTSTNNLFTLLTCGSLVLPEHRGTAFSIRAGMLNLGVLIGLSFGGFIVELSGWQGTMLHSGVTCFASGLAAAFAGSVEKTDYEGVASNANALFKYAFDDEE